MEKNYFIDPRLSKIVPFPVLKLISEQFRPAVETAPAANGQMGLESSFFPLKAHRFQRLFHFRRQGRKAAPLQANPKNPGLSYIRKDPYTSSKNRKAREEAEGSLQRICNRLDFLFFDRPKKL